MDHFDSLVIIAELALGIAGFSGVVVALGAQPGAWAKVDRLRLATLLATGLGALLVVLIAMMLLMLNIAETVVWRISSVVTALIFFATIVTIVPSAWSITRTTTGMKSPYSLAVFIPSVIIGALMVAVQLANALGLTSLDPYGVLFSGLVIMLIISTTQFVRLLFAIRAKKG